MALLYCLITLVSLDGSLWLSDAGVLFSMM